MINKKLFVVTAVSGRTGAATARTLLDAGERVRVVVRDESKGHIWAKQGAEVAIADLSDVDALWGVHGAYVISPQQYSSTTLFEQAEIVADAIAEAAVKVRLPKLVALSSVGADQPKGTGWISMNRMLEQSLEQVGVHVTFLRAAYFIENWSAMVDTVITESILPSFLAPLDQKIAMVATTDVGLIAADALREHWNGVRTIELEGPTPYSPNEVADTFCRALGKPIPAVEIPESDWSKMLSPHGFSLAAIDGFTEMTQGLNTKHITFTGNSKIDHRKGVTPLDTVISTMLTNHEGHSW